MPDRRLSLGPVAAYKDRIAALKAQVDASGGRLEYLLEEVTSQDAVPSDIWSLLAIDPRVQTSSRSLFETGHFSQAIAEAFKDLEESLAKKAGLSAFGVDVPRQAFGGKAKLSLKLHSKERSNSSAQDGYMNLIAGSIQAFRNPRSHETVKSDNAQIATEALILCSHLYRILDQARKVRVLKP